MGEITSHFEHTIAVGPRYAEILTTNMANADMGMHPARISFDAVNTGSAC